jgi:hypothetical protein
MNLAEREESLLRLVAEYREQECRRLLDAARTEAAELLAATFNRERAHLHQRIVAERSRAQGRIQAARAERATRERWVHERTHTDLLAAAWPRLREALLARWRVPRSRAQWVASDLDEALRALPRGRWSIRHAPGWGEDERRAPAARLAEALGEAPRMQTDGDMAAGLVIASGGAVLDASLDGLLRDRPRLEARLLALIEARTPGGEAANERQ